jgi:anti-sigma regulatory factor (Ser/Thr protein kinase)
MAWTLDPGTTAAAYGRALVADALRSWDLERLVEDASLITSELVANAVVHSSGPFDLRVEHAGARVRIEVVDTEEAIPVRHAADPLVPGGLGLIVVDSVAYHWGAERRPRGKSVWAELVT